MKIEKKFPDGFYYRASEQSGCFYTGIFERVKGEKIAVQLLGIAQ